MVLIKTLLMIFGGIGVLHVTPGIDILGSSKESIVEEKVECEYALVGSEEDSKILARQLRVTQEKLKAERHRSQELLDRALEMLEDYEAVIQEIGRRDPSEFELQDPKNKSGRGWWRR